MLVESANLAGPKIANFVNYLISDTP